MKLLTNSRLKFNGMSYQPLFEGAIDGMNHPAAWTIVGADFVTTTDGTGVVHTAVMYGEDDYNLGMKEGFPAQHTVGMDGRFVEGTHMQLDGRYVKDCDSDIIDLLAEQNSLYREHTYSRLPTLLANRSSSGCTMQWTAGSFE